MLIPFTIQMKDGARFTGDTYSSLVRQLWQSAMAHHNSDTDYMRRAARRARLWSGKRVRGSKNAEVFIRDLETAGLLKFL